MLSEAESSTGGLKSLFGLQRVKRNEKHKVTIHKSPRTSKKIFGSCLKVKSLDENSMAGQLFDSPFPPSRSLTGCPKKVERPSFGKGQQPAPFEVSGRGEPQYMADKIFSVPTQNCCRQLAPFISVHQSCFI